MDHTQALEVLNNLRSVLYEKGEITVTPKVYRQVEEAIQEVGVKIDLQEEQLALLAENVEDLRTQRDKYKMEKEDLQLVSGINATTAKIKPSKKKK